MKAQFLQLRNSPFLALTTVFSFGISAPALWAQDDQPGHRSGENPQGHPHGNILTNSMSAPLEEAWATVQESVRDMDAAVRSKNLHGVHVATVKINPALTTLQDHSDMATGENAQKLLKALRHLRHCVLRLHREALDDNQPEAEAELKNVESAFQQVEAQDPENTLKGH
jgi:hypothetical protein